MDFFTVDTMLGKRFYVFALISHKTREGIQFAITEYPTREFIRQQLMLFSETIASRVYLIDDNALMFNIDLLAYNLVSVRIGVEAPNMKQHHGTVFQVSEKRSAGRFSADWQKSDREEMEEYLAFYNRQRPHQGSSKEFRGLGARENR